MDALTLLPAAAEEFGKKVHAVPPDGWERPTPCTDWSVRDVVNHMVGEHLWVPELLGGATVDEVGDRFDGDVLGDDAPAAWDAAIYRSLTAWSQTPADAPVHLSAGDTPAQGYAEQMLVDLVVHGWDISRGAGLDERMDAATVLHALAFVEPHVRWLAASGLFAEPVDVSSDDPQDRLLGLLGRRP
jgi:uncharacterized protein (TIGR03086 family)